MTKGNYHRILERQIHKVFGDRTDFPEDVLAFFDLISTSYKNADADRALVERSLELSSKELSQINARLTQRVKEAEEKTAELEKMNDLMVGRELKMIDLKKEIKSLKQ